MQRPKVVVVSGLPGSGKSTIAEALAEKMKFPIFSVDPIESAILQSGMARSFETGLAAYLVAETLASEQLKLGLSVIIDAVNSVREARAMWHNLATSYDAQLRMIECVLERETHRQRIEARVRNMPGIPEVTWQDVENRRKEYLEWDEERLVLDTMNSLEANLDEVVKYIGPVGNRLKRN